MLFMMLPNNITIYKLNHSKIFANLIFIELKLISLKLHITARNSWDSINFVLWNVEADIPMHSQFTTYKNTVKDIQFICIILAYVK